MSLVILEKIGIISFVCVYETLGSVKIHIPVIGNQCDKGASKRLFEAYDKGCKREYSNESERF